MLTHIDKENKPTMVDVSDKDQTHRTACAQAKVELPVEVMALFDGSDLQSKKGPVFNTAIIAGTMGVKKTGELIPFCHPLAIEGINFNIRLVESVVVIECTVKTFGRTGVEMEALTGAQIAALTIYDMCKAASQNMIIGDCRLVQKSGGKKDFDLHGGQK
ncbi:cyclic pyranopterin monophosphate synthase MoaC [Bacteriovoracaceae bacterium]|jgi:cyclic pyranopterin monophosphate synthase|nr:cyclic pyranopterin monophosphate synthase MoaC [Bacteriovoracaceae bacterium]